MAVKQKTYKQMSRKEKKIAIAKDVIANIHLKNLNIQSGNAYMDSGEIYVEDDLEVLCKYLPSEKVAELLRPKCEFCARGAMMICKVAKFNNYEFHSGYIDQDATTEALKDAFSEDELEDIEAAFELWADCSGRVISLPDNVIENWESIVGAEDRLLAIMQNIIDHDGKFKPEVKYEVYYK